jgi:hypothetical protein
MFRKIWTKRCLINSKGKDTVHKELIIQGLMKTKETTAVNSPGNQKRNSMEAQGNKMADEATKESAWQSEAPIFYFIPVISPTSITPKFCLKRRNDYQK